MARLTCPKLVLLLVIGWLLLAGGVGRAQTLVTNPAPFLTTNFLSGPVSERINIVVFGDGYTTNEALLFQTHVTNVVVNYLFTQEPYRSYREYHNIFSITTASLESGADRPATSTVKDTYFDATFGSGSLDRLLTLKQSSRVYSLLSQFMPIYSIVIVIVNSSVYGGSGGSLAVTSVNGSAPQIMFHELGHSFGQLADEYEDITPGYRPNESVNCTAQTNRVLVKWGAWIEPSTPLPTPETTAYAALAGLFEGCMYTNKNWFRPHYNSFMRSLGSPIGQINAEQFVRRFYQHWPDHIEPFQRFTPLTTNLTVTGLQDLSFAVEPMKPSYHALAVGWAINGTNQASQSATNFTIPSASLGLGQHTVSCVVSDATSFVRIYTNAYFALNPLRKTVQWQLNVTTLDPPLVQLTAPAPNSYLPPSENALLQASATASQGVARVEFLVNGTPIGQSLAAPFSVVWSNPAPGSYTLSARATAHLGDIRTSPTVAITVAASAFEAWQHNQFSPPQLADASLSGAAADPDGDGFTNFQEFLAGTGPLNPTSALRIATLSPGPDGLLLRFATVPGKTYRVEWSASLRPDDWHTLQSAISGSGDVVTVTDRDGPAYPQRFYRVRLEN